MRTPILSSNVPWEGISEGAKGRSFGLRSTELRILNVLDGAGSISINEMARRTHVDKAWASRSVGDFEAKKLCWTQA